MKAVTNENSLLLMIVCMLWKPGNIFLCVFVTQVARAGKQDCVRDIVSATLCPQQCVRNIVSTTLCPQQCVRDIVPATMCPRHCIRNNVSAILYPQQCVCNIVSATLHPQQCVRDIVSATMLPQHFVRKFVRESCQFRFLLFVINLPFVSWQGEKSLGFKI